jgi:arylsulfatase A-like enzyme
MDLMPTYLELAGAKMSGSKNHIGLDGKTLAPILFEGLPMTERALFWRRGKEWAVRRGPWKLVGSARRKMMLFNLEEDIGEQNDLVKERAGLVEELLAIYKEWERDVTREK